MDATSSRHQLSERLARVAQGDRQALSAVYRATSAKLFGICLRILGDRGEAEDVLQEVYLTVWNKAAAFDASRASPITWLVAIARNRAIDRLRAGGVIRKADPIDAALDIGDPAPSPAAEVESADERRRLETCLQELEPQHSAAIRTAFLDGVTYEELAAQMDVPLGTMKSWIRRGLLRLRACLER